VKHDEIVAELRRLLPRAQRGVSDIQRAEGVGYQKASMIQWNDRQDIMRLLPSLLEALSTPVDRDLLRARVEQLEKALQTELNELMKRNEGRTHYPGCEKEHPMCAAIGRIRAALPQPERGGGA
jgi:hypothetical protein